MICYIVTYHMRSSRLPATRTWKSRMKHFAVLGALAFFACAPLAAADALPGPIKAIGVENEYADVISQVGGEYVDVQAIETDPNTDPHTFEASPKIAKEIAGAQLIVLNG